MAQEQGRMLLENLVGALRQHKGVARYIGHPLGMAEAAASLEPIADAPGIEIRWLGLNGSRADAEIISEDGREWRVVFTTEDAARLTALWVFERPAPFQGVDGGRAVVLDGAVGAGKSTLMEQLAKAEDTPWVVFDELNLGKIHTNHLIWLDSCGPLYRGFLAGIAALAAAGNQVIMPSSGLPQQMFLDALGVIPTLYVALECPLTVLIERNHGREGRWAGLAERSFTDFVANRWRYDLVLDSHVLSTNALVAEVREALGHEGIQR